MKDVTYVERSVATKAQQKQIAGTKKSRYCNYNNGRDM